MSVSESSRKRKSVNGVLTAGGLLLQQVLGFVGGVFVANLLGPADYGQVSVLRNLLMLAIVLSPLGLDLALFRILPRFDSAPHDQALHFRRFRLIVFGFGTMMVAFCGYVIGPTLARSVYEYSGFGPHFAITLLAIPFATDVILLTSWYRVHGNIVPILLITYYFQPIVRTVLNVLAVYSGYGVTGVVVGTTAAYLTAFLIALLYYAWTRRGASRPTDVPEPAWNKSWHQFSEAPPMALNMFTGNLIRTADLVIVGAIASAHAAGEYAVVSNLAQLVPVAATSLIQTLGPTIARHHQNGDKAAIARDINHTIRWASLLASFIFGGIAGFGGHLDVIFGPAYRPAPAITLLIPLGYLLSATLSPASYALTMCGHSKSDLAILIASTFALIATCIPLTYAFGTEGAAAAVLIAFTMVNVLRLLAVNRFLGVRVGTWRDLVPPIVALGIAVVVNQLIVPQDASIVPLLGGCVAYAFIYGMIMFGGQLVRLLRSRLRAGLLL